LWDAECFTVRRDGFPEYQAGARGPAVESLKLICAAHTRGVLLLGAVGLKLVRFSGEFAGGDFVVSTGSGLAEEVAGTVAASELEHCGK